MDTVSWNDARDYCAKAGMRLPTEAEWEYAARGRKTTARFGDPDAAGWFLENSRDQTHPVRQKLPNAFGLYDMLGNLWQWVADWFGEAYYAHSELADPKGPPTGTLKVLRGGSWHKESWYGRVSDRNSNEPDVKNYALGFRCAGDLL